MRMQELNTRFFQTRALQIPCLVLLLAYHTGAYPTAVGQTSSFNLIEASVPDIQMAIDDGLITSESLVQQYIHRIETFSESGPNLNAVISLNPDALETARALDAERVATGSRGPLHGIPVLLKDNIDTFDIPTTAGALALKDSLPPDDAFITNQLRDAGAIILGKASMSEWAYWLDDGMPNGFSAINGQTLNPYGPGEFDPVGSSTGSAVTVSANLAPIAIGTETLGSIMSPSWANSVVGIRPTLGLVSRDGIIPITHSQDTAGPMTRSVTDAAILLGAMAGVDPNDPATAASQGQIPSNYTQFLRTDGLQGKRIGVVRHPVLQPDFLLPHSLPVLEQALTDLQQLGATLVDDLDMSASMFALFDLWGPNPPPVLTFEFESNIEKYFESLGEDAPVKTLGELIAFNAANADEAIPFGQSLLELAAEFGDMLDSPEYQQQLNDALRLMGPEGFDMLLESNNLDALVFTEAWSSFGAIPGYPSITVPAGYDRTGHPVSIEFLAGPYTEPQLIEMAYAYEQGTERRQPPSIAPSIEGDYVGFGDLDGDGRLSIADLDVLATAIRSGENASEFDMTGDGQVDLADLEDFVTSRKRLNSTIGDVDLSGWFDSSDLIAVFQAGEYEDELAENSSWATGDWNADGDFNSADLIFAMQQGEYVTSIRPMTAAVPEPSTFVLLSGLSIAHGLAIRRRPTCRRCVS